MKLSSCAIAVAIFHVSLYALDFNCSATLFLYLFLPDAFHKEAHPCAHRTPSMSP